MLRSMRPGWRCRRTNGMIVQRSMRRRAALSRMMRDEGAAQQRHRRRWRCRNRGGPFRQMSGVQTLVRHARPANEAIGLVTFQTRMSFASWSGVSCSLNIEEVSPNKFRVSGTGKQNVRGDQLFALDLFGEAKSKAHKAIEMMKELARSEAARS